MAVQVLISQTAIRASRNRLIRRKQWLTNSTTIDHHHSNSTSMTKLKFRPKISSCNCNMLLQLLILCVINLLLSPSPPPSASLSLAGVATLALAQLPISSEDNRVQVRIGVLLEESDHEQANMLIRTIKMINEQKDKTIRQLLSVSSSSSKTNKHQAAPLAEDIRRRDGFSSSSSLGPRRYWHQPDEQTARQRLRRAPSDLALGANVSTTGASGGFWDWFGSFGGTDDDDTPTATQIRRGQDSSDSTNVEGNVAVDEALPLPPLTPHYPEYYKSQHVGTQPASGASKSQAASNENGHEYADSINKFTHATTYHHAEGNLGVNGQADFDSGHDDGEQGPSSRGRDRLLEKRWSSQHVNSFDGTGSGNNNNQNNQNRVNFNIKLEPMIEFLDDGQSALEADGKVCQLIESGAHAIVGPIDGGASIQHVQSICDNLEIPYFELRPFIGGTLSSPIPTPVHFMDHFSSGQHESKQQQLSSLANGPNNNNQFQATTTTLVLGEMLRANAVIAASDDSPRQLASRHWLANHHQAPNARQTRPNTANNWPPNGAVSKQVAGGSKTAAPPTTTTIGQQQQHETTTTTTTTSSSAIARRHEQKLALVEQQQQQPLLQTWDSTRRPDPLDNDVDRSGHQFASASDDDLANNNNTTTTATSQTKLAPIESAGEVDAGARPLNRPTTDFKGQKQAVSSAGGGGGDMLSVFEATGRQPEVGGGEQTPQAEDFYSGDLAAERRPADDETATATTTTVDSVGSGNARDGSITVSGEHHQLPVLGQPKHWVARLLPANSKQQSGTLTTGANNQNLNIHSAADHQDKKPWLLQHDDNNNNNLDNPFHTQPLQATGNNKLEDLTLNLYPPSHLLTSAYIDLIYALNWTSFAIVYEDGSSMIKLQDLFKESSGSWSSRWKIRLFRYDPNLPLFDSNLVPPTSGAAAADSGNTRKPDAAEARHPNDLDQVNNNNNNIHHTGNQDKSLGNQKRHKRNNLSSDNNQLSSSGAEDALDQRLSPGDNDDDDDLSSLGEGRSIKKRHSAKIDGDIEQYLRDSTTSKSGNINQYHSNFRDSNGKRQETSTFRDVFWRIKLIGEHNILLDVKVDNLYTALKQAQQVGCMTEEFSYLITSLDLHTLDLEDFKYSRTRITGFSMLQVAKGQRSVDNKLQQMDTNNAFDEAAAAQANLAPEAVENNSEIKNKHNEKPISTRKRHLQHSVGDEWPIFDEKYLEDLGVIAKSSINLSQQQAHYYNGNGQNNNGDHKSQPNNGYKNNNNHHNLYHGSATSSKLTLPSIRKSGNMMMMMKNDNGTTTIGTESRLKDARPWSIWAIEAANNDQTKRELLQSSPASLSLLPTVDRNNEQRLFDFFLQQQEHDLSRIRLSTSSAILHDSLILYMLGLNQLDPMGNLLGNLGQNQANTITCSLDTQPWSHGSSMVNYMRRISFNGLTGAISFDPNGLRNNFKLDVMGMAPNLRLVKVGEWHSRWANDNRRHMSPSDLDDQQQQQDDDHDDDGGQGQMTPVKRTSDKTGQQQQQPDHNTPPNSASAEKMSYEELSSRYELELSKYAKLMAEGKKIEVPYRKRVSPNGALLVNDIIFERLYRNQADQIDTLIVTAKLSQPYFMLKETPNRLDGNDQFEGYAVDLIHELSKLVNFKYKWREVADKKYGSKEILANGSVVWNGMIGEIVRGVADLAIVDLTITAQREEAVDFTLPFMNTGISILFKKPTTKVTTLFSFLSPFSSDVWAYVLAAYCGISAILFLVGHVSPYEWADPHPCRHSALGKDGAVLKNQFSLLNSFWFTIGSLMQQGSDLTPRSMSTRTIAGIWYFFTLIMISSYTANLAAFLTVEKVVYPIENVRDLSQQQEIKYGCVESGSTCLFFHDSQIDTYKKIDENMSKFKTYVRSNDEGQKRVGEGKFAFFMESTTIEYIIERNCNLTQIGGLIDSKGYGLATSKKSRHKRPYRTLLNEGILHLQETGMLHVLKNRWWKERRGGGTCTDDGKGGGVTELSLANVGGVFVVLLGGLGISFLVAIAEFMWRARRSGSSRDRMCEEMMNDLKFALACKSSTKPNNKTTGRGFKQQQLRQRLMQQQGEKSDYSIETIQYQDSLINAQYYNESTLDATSQQQQSARNLASQLTNSKDCDPVLLHAMLTMLTQQQQLADAQQQQQQQQQPQLSVQNLHPQQLDTEALLVNGVDQQLKIDQNHLYKQQQQQQILLARSYTNNIIQQQEFNEPLLINGDKQQLQNWRRADVDSSLDDVGPNASSFGNGADLLRRQQNGHRHALHAQQTIEIADDNLSSFPIINNNNKSNHINQRHTLDLE